MKPFFTLAFVIIASIATAQNPLGKAVGDFNEVKVYDLIEVNLIKANEAKVEITGDDIEDVEVINKDGKLKIRMKFNKTFNGDRTFVAVYYNTLDIIDGNEGAFISANELIEQNSIELKAQEGARLKIGLDVNQVTIKAVSGGVVETKGKAISQDITLNTGGVYEGKSFETQNTTVNIKAAGEADINASKTVNAKVIAGGDIFIYGNPEKVNEKRTLGGRIKRMD
ncbi:Putative auto-transporter adhesin, head GIN domain [Formosa sp. Hel1_31_208]|uniref:head GIN domain-containing protein n=1 Tax=Formosa sp. Hel1_31_208 TaxID=1798225 RepID=UPI00087C669C|nr:head GIN domain-containing protein [Formosa sp. Hel1_31_208]SDR73936.1 Putative auto-transporter adhesin, head GIN domain [Formosa sp. Hel1_31_208]